VHAASDQPKPWKVADGTMPTKVVMTNGRVKSAGLSRAEKLAATRDALFRSALQIVAENGYAGASVARITNAAGVSQGTFYSYFDNLQQLLGELLPVEGRKLLDLLAQKSGGSDDYFEHEKRAFQAFFAYNRDNRHFLRVLTEAEIAAPESFAKHMTNIEGRYLNALHRAIENGQIRRQSPQAFRAIAEVLAGSRGHVAIGLSFADEGYLSVTSATETYLKFIQFGLGSKASAYLPKAAIKGRKLKRSASTDTKALLIAAAGEIIHKRGFVGTTIAGVVQAAGMGIGTFYRHFDSREHLLGEVLKQLRHEMIDFIGHRVRDSRSFVELELRGFTAFFDYLSYKPWLIRIESEAAVWAHDSYREHFQDLSGRYVAAMIRSKQAGELVDYDSHELPVLAFMFMASRHYLATRYIIINSRKRKLPDAVKDAYTGLVERGLRP
jgi:AcrR family transcriptional regulator